MSTVPLFEELAIPHFAMACSKVTNRLNNSEIAIARRRRIVDNAMSTASEAGFDKVDLLEAMIENGATDVELVPLCTKLINYIGLAAYKKAIENAGFDFATEEWLT